MSFMQISLRVSIWLGIFMVNSVFGTETILELQRLPKAELHLHLGGSFPKEYLFTIATTKQQEDLDHFLQKIAQGLDYNSAFQVFNLIAQIVNTEEKLQKGVEHLCMSLQEDNVRYVEIRTGLKDLGQGFEAYLQAVLRGVDAQASDQFKAKVVLSLQRSSSLESAKETIDLALKYQNQGVVGIDISGNSTIGQIDQMIPELMRAKREGLKFIVHMGEAPEEVDQMLLLTLLEPLRIGHGVYLSREAKEWILKHRIPLEVCLTSSVLVKMIKDYNQHPGLDFFRLAHPIVFCTDDPLIFSTTLSHELLRAHQNCGLDIQDLKAVIERTFDYALEILNCHNLLNERN